MTAPLNTTYLDPRVGWVAGPDGRGTMDLVWSCVATLFICTWTVLHLDFVWPMYRGWQTTKVRKLKWMVFTLFMPEYVNALAIEQFCQAKRSKQLFQTLGYENWTLRHGFFAVMNGFPIKCGDRMYALRINELHWLFERGLVRGKLDLPASHDSNLLSFEDALSEKGIRESSKSDTLAKLIACFQSAWLVIQSIARVIEGQDLSPLELMTIAFVLSTFITFAFWLKKPVEPTFCKVLEVEAERSEWWDDMCHALSIPENRKIEAVKYEEGTGDLHLNGQSQFHACWTFLLGAAFGSIHCLAWNLTFPSYVERTLWRACSLYCSVFPLYLLTSTKPVITALAKWFSTLSRIKLEKVMRSFNRLEHDNSGSKLYLMALFLTLLFASARAFLIVEAFISIRSLPQGVYQSVKWPNYIPHI